MSAAAVLRSRSTSCALSVEPASAADRSPISSTTGSFWRRCTRRATTRLLAVQLQDGASLRCERSENDFQLIGSIRGVDTWLVTYSYSPCPSMTARILDPAFGLERSTHFSADLMASLRILFPIQAEAPVSTDAPLHERKKPGGPGDYKMIDEFGREVWASDWCRKAYQETKPQPVLRRRGRR